MLSNKPSSTHVIAYNIVASDDSDEKNKQEIVRYSAGGKSFLRG